MGLPMIGITVNLILGVVSLLAAFILLAYGFWHWEKARQWGDAARVNTLWGLGLVYVVLVGFQVYSQYQKDHTASDRTTIQANPTSAPKSILNPVPGAQVQPEPRSTIPKLQNPSNSAPKQRTSSVEKPSAPIQSPTMKSSLFQSNSGGVNVQQGTTGDNSPIVNSPITIGSVPKDISPQEMDSIIRYLSSAPIKARVRITADQFSGNAPFPEKFYDALKNAGWNMLDDGVNSMMEFSPPGKKFQGAVLYVNGIPLKPNEIAYPEASDH
jgi:hypothetical protein